jgi:hypothetical protein
VSALVTQLGFARYADSGYGLVLLHTGVAMAAVGLLWFAAATELWQFVAARAVLGASVGMIIPAARQAIVLASSGTWASGSACSTPHISPVRLRASVAGVLTIVGDVRLPFVVLAVAVARAASRCAVSSSTSPVGAGPSSRSPIDVSCGDSSSSGV